MRPSLLEDNDEMLASPLEMKVEEPLSFTNAVENKEEISTSNATQHKTMTAEEYQDKPMQEKVKNEIAQESSKKAPQININYKSSISTSNNKPKLTSVPVSLLKIVSGNFNFITYSNAKIFNKKRLIFYLKLIYLEDNI